MLGGQKTERRKCVRYGGGRVRAQWREKKKEAREMAVGGERERGRKSGSESVMRTRWWKREE